MSDEFEWQCGEPETERMSSARLGELRRGLVARRTKTLIVARNDRIVEEWYAGDFGPRVRHYTASLAKALVGGLSLMLALDDGLLAADDRACDYVPRWRDDPLRARITVRHLATHSAGVENAELTEEERQRALEEGREVSDRHMGLPGWKGRFWRREPNPFLNARDDAPIVFEPGTDYAYSNPGMGMLAYVVTAALRGGPHRDIRTLLRERIMRPIGVADDEWSVGYGDTFEADGLPLVANWGGGSFSARAVARVGRLMLRRGRWRGQALISPEVVDMATGYAGTPVPERSPHDPAPASGLGWWVNQDGVWPSLPRDAYAGAGAGNQILLVVPTWDAVVVRNGGQIGGTFWGGAERHLFRPLARAVEPPTPRSPVIARIDWAPKERIVRLCHRRGRDGSDNWPVTWADDGRLYTAWGDGWGFEPGTEEKLSMGVARVEGRPPEVRGENVDSDAEAPGMGRSGRKACGMLCVDGVLYMWVRNADGDGHHCRLGFSTDHGRHWRWADWRFERFGYCTFLNFGRDYAGARDDYVYVYSHDGPSAYEAADRMILMRVPKDAITDRAAYEFFAGTDGSADPVWSGRVERREAVFIHPRRCLRSAVSYDAGLERYLWWQQLPNDPRSPDVRFSGGFAVYDAPEPWGPWTCPFYAELWDVGPGETGSFPTPWMSEDGRAVQLVFSGDDTFAVRRARFLLRGRD
ncbi:MAG: serine hydrolase [Planctomycetota bacterium]